MGERAETGAITLAMTLWLLVVFALVAVHAAQGVRSAIDLDAYDGYGAEALAAAEAGLGDGLARLGRRRGRGLPTPFSVRRGDGAVYRVGFARLAGMAGRPVLITSRSTAADGRTVRGLERVAVFVAELPRPPPAAVEVGGRAGSTAGVRIVNAFGGPTLLDGLTTGTSAARGPATGFMGRLFERPADEQRESSRIVDCPGVCRIVETADRGPALWVRARAGRAITLGRLEVGSHAWPRVVVIDGSVTVRHGLRVLGLCLVLGDLRARGGEVSVDGALVVQGGLALGTGRVVYDPVLLGALRVRGRYRWLAGSWHPLPAVQGGDGRTGG